MYGKGPVPGDDKIQDLYAPGTGPLPYMASKLLVSTVIINLVPVDAGESSHFVL